MSRLPDSRLLALIERARTQDADALNELALLVRHRLKGTFHPQVGPIESSDLAQVATLNVSLYLDGFHGTTEDEFWGWVRVVARNVASESIRRGKAKKRGGPLSPLPEDSRGGVRVANGEPTPSEVIQRQELATEVLEALALLSPQESLVIKLRNFENKDWSEVALQLGKSIEATRKSYHRAIKKWSEKCENL
jgi:RNA polymerase sigma factor (sigma-70 family)